MRKLLATASVLLLMWVAGTAPVKADSMTYTIDFNDLPLGSVPDDLNHDFGVKIQTWDWLSLGIPGCSYWSTFSEFSECGLYSQPGKIAQAPFFTSHPDLNGVYDGSPAVSVSSGSYPPEVWDEYLEQYPDGDFPSRHARIRVDFLIPVTDFSVDAISEIWGSAVSYHGLTAAGDPFSGGASLPPYHWQHIVGQAPAGGRITGFDMEVGDSSGVHLHMDNLSFTTPVPEAGSAVFLGLGCVGLLLFGRRT